MATFSLQKRREREETLRQVQQKHYRDYLYAIQRVLTACVRSDHDLRRAAIDDFRSAEAYLYVAAPRLVADELPELHVAFVNYTRSIRCKYEKSYAERYGSEYGVSKLADFEERFLDCYRVMVNKMRRATVDDDGEIVIELSLASREKR